MATSILIFAIAFSGSIVQSIADAEIHHNILHDVLKKHKQRLKDTATQQDTATATVKETKKVGWPFGKGEHARKATAQEEKAKVEEKKTKAKKASETKKSETKKASSAKAASSEENLSSDSNGKSKAFYLPHALCFMCHNERTHLNCGTQKDGKSLTSDDRSTCLVGEKKCYDICHAEKDLMALDDSPEKWSDMADLFFELKFGVKPSDVKAGKAQSSD